LLMKKRIRSRALKKVRLLFHISAV
jgi:hypothetical protein